MECGGASICQHQRIRSRCNECCKEEDMLMPAGLEQLADQGMLLVNTNTHSFPAQRTVRTSEVSWAGGDRGGNKVVS